MGPYGTVCLRMGRQTMIVQVNWRYGINMIPLLTDLIRRNYIFRRQNLRYNFSFREF